MPPTKLQALQEVKRRLYETISEKSFRVAGMLILNTDRGSSDQDICRTSLKHVAFILVPKVWELCKQMWEMEEEGGNAAFPITIKETLDHMNYDYP